MIYAFTLPGTPPQPGCSNPGLQEVSGPPQASRRQICKHQATRAHTDTQTHTHTLSLSLPLPLSLSLSPPSSQGPIHIRYNSITRTLQRYITVLCIIGQQVSNVRSLCVRFWGPLTLGCLDLVKKCNFSVSAIALASGILQRDAKGTTSSGSSLGRVR